MLFPLFFDLSKEHVLVVGAGKIAARRIRSLCGFVSDITVVAPRIDEAIRQLANEYPIRILERMFQIDDLQEMNLVLAATDRHEINRIIYDACKKQHILVNVCSDQNLCDFQFPSVIEHGDLVIGLNASGKNHRLVKETRIEIEKALHANTKYDHCNTMEE